MAYEFSEHDPELEPQASSARLGGPPRKFTGIGILDRRVRRRDRPDQSPLNARACSGVLGPRCFLRGWRP